jgi:DNA modification methylase
MSKSKTSSPAVDRGLEVERVEVSTLLNDPANVRKHNERNLESIKASLARFGQQKPIVVGRDGVVIAGNGTLAAARSLGWSMIDIVRSHLTGAEATAYAIADNRTAELAEWDEESLAQQLAALQIEDEELLAATGFDEKELEAMSGPAEVEEDEVPEPPVDPITKPGDLWILGEHRLLCGDSTNADDVERLMAGAKAGMMVTDPPYGVNYDPEMRSTAKSVGKIANDDRASWLDAWSLFSGDVAYVWHASLFTSVVLADLESAGLRHVSMIIWKKPYATFSMANYHWQHEPCWYCVRPSGRRNWIGSPKESTVWDMTQPKDPYGRSGEDKTPHPTQKPVEAMARPMRNHDHQIVYDPFLGSGTTLIAAEQLGRKCYGMEISPAYCDVIVKRWETLTGKKAERGA